MLHLSANDYIEIMALTTDTGIKLDFPTPTTTPETPSLIVTAQQVMYTQIGPTGHTGPTGPLPTIDISTNTLHGVSYDPNNSTWHYNPAKAFIIDHPHNNEKYLVHTCLEGPEVGVYYRGKSEITNGLHSVDIKLPDYIPGWASDFTINVTGIYDGKIKIYNSSEVDEKGTFTVYGESGKFNWTAIGKRDDINPEPFKYQVVIKGNGPYKWIEK